MSADRGTFRACALAAAALAGLSGWAGCRGGDGSEPAPVQPAAPAKAVATGHVRFPLRVSANRRHLVDSAGRPFLIVGDSPQAMVVKLSVRQADHFIADRAAAGFNTIWVNLVSNDYTGGVPSGMTFDGIRPFTERGRLSTPNVAYFARADRMIRSAARHGMAVLLDPIETGGWLKVLRANGTDAAYEFGRYLGRRYRRMPNIVWMSGNDFQSWRNARDDELVLAVARGIRDTDPVHIQTTELDYHGLVSSSFDDRRWRGLLQLDAAYTYLPTYDVILRDYRLRDHVPIFMVEASYEGEHDYVGPSTLRRQEYWTLLSGAAGQLYGNKYTWQFIEGWQDNLDTVGSRQMTYVTNLFSPRRWYDLVPDTGHSLVVAGSGPYRATGTVQDSDYVTAARTGDGRLAIAYLPAGQTIRVNMAELAGRVRARWYDPATERYRAVRGAPFANDGVRRFAPPGNNGDGDPDWVLLLEAG
jgi:hypothetical protein